MKLSTKGRYAMVAMADLALQAEGEMTSLADIAKRQDLSLPYLEQLFVRLRREGLVVSVRGPGGGYRLAKPAAEIRVVEIFSAVEETVSAMHKGRARQRYVGQSRAKHDQSAVGKPQRPCLCLFAPNTAVGCDPQ